MLRRLVGGVWRQSDRWLGLCYARLLGPEHWHRAPHLAVASKPSTVVIQDLLHLHVVRHLAICVGTSLQVSGEGVAEG